MIVLVTILTGIYGLEVIIAAVLGFPNVRTMLTMLSFNEKRLVAFTIGPLIHQGNMHLLGNVVSLMVFGSYVEWHIGWRRFLIISAIVGYGATWLLLMTEIVGAVGASSITHGLESITVFVGVVRFSEEFLSIQDMTDIFRPIAHTIPVIIGFHFAVEALRAGMNVSINATVAIHALGALVGLVIGSWYLTDSVRKSDALAPYVTR